MPSPTRATLIALSLVAWMVSASGCEAESAQRSDTFAPTPTGGSAPAPAGSESASGEEPYVYYGTPVDSLTNSIGMAGSGAEMNLETPPSSEQDDSATGTPAGDDDPVDPVPPPAPATSSGANTRSPAPDAAVDPLADMFPPPSTPADRIASPDNPAECPDEAPENPVGPCAGLPVYVVCTYGTYTCICDWIHWMCAG